MKCYYEILGVGRDATDEELKKAYKKLALKWHPDKNRDNEEEAKENFQLVQQAFEVLIDPHERTWYDNHREAILKGGLGSDYKDDSLNILPYFSASCYKGFGDDPKGFYAVYEEVFNKLAAEDSEYMTENDPDIPQFGKSNSSYEAVVGPFYSYWMSYSTKKSYFWLDPYDTREAPNHKVAKLIEKENKKVRDKAKKERNEEVRNLVAFVRKRDKRVQEWSKMLEKKAEENLRKSEEDRLRQINERKNKMKDYKESDWLKFSNVENDLKQIEESLVKEYGDVSTSDDEVYEEETCYNEGKKSSFLCVACNKVFKTAKAFANHEKSKRHKDNVAVLKQTMHEENNALQPSINGEKTPKAEEIDNNLSSHDVSDNEKSKKKKLRKKTKKELYIVNSSESEEDFDHVLPLQKGKPRNKISFSDDSGDDLEKKGKKKNKKQSGKTSFNNQTEINKSYCDNLESNLLKTLKLNVEESKENLTKAESLKCKKNKQTESKKSKIKSEIDTDVVCAVCKSQFPSKNKLFNHLKATGHSVYLPKAATGLKEDSNEFTKKNKRKKDLE